MWCIGKLTPEYIKRMEDILDLYERPYNKKEPVVCFDEDSCKFTPLDNPLEKLSMM